VRGHQQRDRHDAGLDGALDQLDLGLLEQVADADRRSSYMATTTRTSSRFTTMSVSAAAMNAGTGASVSDRSPPRLV
jgi:hypothetical protein